MNYLIEEERNRDELFSQVDHINKYYIVHNKKSIKKYSRPYSYIRLSYIKRIEFRKKSDTRVKLDKQFVLFNDSRISRTKFKKEIAILNQIAIVNGCENYPNKKRIKVKPFYK